MKKWLTVLLAVVMLATFAACGGASSSAPAAASSGAAAPAGSTSAPASGGSQSDGQVVLLVSAAGALDDRAFNQACYQGVKDWCGDNGYTYTYYQPPEDTAEAQLIVCDTAVAAGAEFIIINSDQFKVSASMMTEKYPDITFIIYDTIPETAEGEQVIDDNIEAIIFAEEQAGFLAGYAAVMDGHRKLGYTGGMAVPAVVRFGYGYVEGAEYAANKLGLADGEIEMKYTYFGNFEATPDNQSLCASWYNEGIEVIFCAAGPAGASAFAAAEQNNGLVIGVDSDQSGESETVIASAIKDLQASTYTALDSWKDGTFKGGQQLRYSAKEGGVGIPMETAKFTNFNQEQYDEIFAILADDVDGISSGLTLDTDADDPTEIPLTKVSLTYYE